MMQSIIIFCEKQACRCCWLEECPGWDIAKVNAMTRGWREAPGGGLFCPFHAVKRDTPQTPTECFQSLLQPCSRGDAHDIAKREVAKAVHEFGECVANISMQMAATKGPDTTTLRMIAGIMCEAVNGAKSAWRQHDKPGKAT